MTRAAGESSAADARRVSGARFARDGEHGGKTGGAMEVVRFRVEPSQEEEFLAKRPSAIEAMREGAPGFVAARLGRVGDGAWVHVVDWEDREKAAEGGERAMRLLAVRSWVAHIDEVLSLEHAEVEEGEGAG